MTIKTFNQINRNELLCSVRLIVDEKALKKAVITAVFTKIKF